LRQGQVVGFSQGRFEWGPRALGNRSILADPRRPDMKEVVNTKIKFREPFRPFAPVVPEDQAARYFDMQKADGQYPPRFMLMVAPALQSPSAEIPAVVHMGTGRLQTVRREWNPLYHDVIRGFGDATGVPVLLNTSFNLRGEPLVATPANAIGTFMASGIDLLVLERFLVRKGYRAIEEAPALRPPARYPNAAALVGGGGRVMVRPAAVGLSFLGVLVGLLMLEILLRVYFGIVGYPGEQVGWRNAAVLVRADIVAIGDSQTYGYNVPADAA